MWPADLAFKNPHKGVPVCTPLCHQYSNPSIHLSSSDYLEKAQQIINVYIWYCEVDICLSVHCGQGLPLGLLTQLDVFRKPSIETASNQMSPSVWASKIIVKYWHWLHKRFFLVKASVAAFCIKSSYDQQVHRCSNGHKHLTKWVMDEKIALQVV